MFRLWYKAKPSLHWVNPPSLLPYEVLGWGSRQLRLPVLFDGLDINWYSLYSNCAIGDLVICREVFDTYVHAE